MLGHKGLMLLMQSPIVLTTLYHFPLALHHSICFTSHIPLPITPALSHPPPMPFILFLIPLVNFLAPVTFGSYLVTLLKII